MSKVKIEGNASGTGTLTISAPNTNTDRSLTLPDTAGEFVTADSSGNVVVTGTVEFGDSHTIGNDANNNLEIASSTGENIVYDTAGGSHLWKHNGTERMRINSSGNVGIGTSSPNYKLDVQGDNLGGTSGDTVDVLQLYSNVGNSSYLNFQKVRTSTGSTWNSAGTRIQQVTDVTQQGYIQFNGDNDYGISFGRGVSTERMRITSNGRGLSPFTVFAWASWSDTGTVNVGGSHNLSSISEGTQNWGFYFANSAPSANYAAVASLESGATNTAFEVGAKGASAFVMWQSVGGGSNNSINSASVIVVGSGF